MNVIGKVVALGAHPDDLELGCGATLAKLAQRGVDLTAIILSEGGAGGDLREVGLSDRTKSRGSRSDLGAGRARL